MTEQNTPQMTHDEMIYLLKGMVFGTFDRTTPEERVALNMAIETLEQEPKMEQFAKWVAREIFDEMWEYNQDAFAEIACRKLATLGIVRSIGGEWELVEPQESEDEGDE